MLTKTAFKGKDKTISLFSFHKGFLMTCEVCPNIIQEVLEDGTTTR